VAVNSLPIEGRAMLMDDPTKGVKNEVKTATIRAYFRGEMDIIGYRKGYFIITNILLY